MFDVAQGKRLVNHAAGLAWFRRLDPGHRGCRDRRYFTALIRWQSSDLEVHDALSGRHLRTVSAIGLTPTIAGAAVSAAREAVVAAKRVDVGGLSDGATKWPRAPHLPAQCAWAPGLFGWPRPRCRGGAGGGAEPRQETTGSDHDPGDPTSCDLIGATRAIDGSSLRLPCGGTHHTAVPPGTEPSAVTWIGTRRNPARRRQGLGIVSYNDCCGKGQLVAAARATATRTTSRSASRSGANDYDSRGGQLQGGHTVLTARSRASWARAK